LEIMVEFLKLDQIQKWMQAVIAHPEGIAQGVKSPEAQREIPLAPESVESVVERSRSLSSLERLQIYGNAYYARLVECLRDEFPALFHAMGQEEFDAYAMGYLQSYPSQSYTLAQLGKNLPAFLEEVKPPPAEERRERPWQFFIDVARLERIYAEVFDGPGSEGAPTLSAESLQRIPPDEWPLVRLVPAPSLRLARFAFPVHDYVTRVRREESPEIPGPSETFLAINRREFVVRRMPLAAVPFELLSNLVAGHPLGEAMALTLESTGADFDQFASGLSSWFQDWTNSQFFSRVKISDSLADAVEVGEGP
jgi:hypothetical protein